MIHRLRQPGRKAYFVWRIVGEVVAESMLSSRAAVRRATVELLQTLTKLKKDRRLFVWKRRYLVVLDIEQENISLEAYREVKLLELQQ